MSVFKRILASRAVGKSVYLFCVKTGKNAYEVMAMNPGTKVTITMAEADTLENIAAVWQVYKQVPPDVIGLMLAHAAHSGPTVIFKDFRLT